MQFVAMNIVVTSEIYHMSKLSKRYFFTSIKNFFIF